MYEIFLKGGPIMWPLLLASVTALAVVIERVFFILGERAKRDPKSVERILFHVQIGETAEALEAGKPSEDSVARVLTYGLEHGEENLPNALMRAASQELKRYDRGLPV